MVLVQCGLGLELHDLDDDEDEKLWETHQFICDRCAKLMSMVLQQEHKSGIKLNPYLRLDLFDKLREKFKGVELT